MIRHHQVHSHTTLLLNQENRGKHGTVGGDWGIFPFGRIQPPGLGRTRPSLEDRQPATEGAWAVAKSRALHHALNNTTLNNYGFIVPWDFAEAQ